MKTINVGVIGLGTVGGGVCKTLLSKENVLREKTGLNVKLSAVFDLDKKRFSRLGIPKKLVAASVNDILTDPDIDIVVELIGGISPAREIVETAFENHKHVVTANKALLAAHGSEIFGAAQKFERMIGFQASVGGAMPVIKSIREGFIANKISALYGIVNGTCNFILSRMSDDNARLKDALKQAQDKGLAEANPTLDIDGHDSCHKLCILAMLSFGSVVRPSDIYVEGIRALDLEDIIYAKDWGYEIKLLAIAKTNEGRVELRVHPTLIPSSHLLSAVKNEDNAVFVKGDLIGESMIYGKGAGSLPAASSVLSDIFDCARYMSFSDSGMHIYFSALGQSKAPKASDIGELVTKYYLRFSAVDKPGVLSYVASVLAKNSISIATVSQKQRKEGKCVPIVMLTHEAKESSMRKALKEINKHKFIKSRTVMIRIEQ